jgi:hypothetical protein
LFDYFSRVLVPKANIVWVNRVLWYPANVLLEFWTIWGGIIWTQTQNHVLVYFLILGYSLFALWEAVFERLLHWRQHGLYFWEYHCSIGTLSYPMQISRSFNCSKHKIFQGVNLLCLSEVGFYWLSPFLSIVPASCKFLVKVFAILASFFWRSWEELYRLNKIQKLSDRFINVSQHEFLCNENVLAF